MLIESELSQFTGSETYTRWSPQLFPKFNASEGALYVAEQAGAYWLLDAIASHWRTVCQNEDAAQFCLWELTRNGNGAVLTCRSDLSTPAIVEQQIEYTDFPLPYIKLYQGLNDFGKGIVHTIYLPSEY